MRIRRVVAVSFLFCAAAVVFAGGAREEQAGAAGGQEIVGISKIVSHPALDAIEKGIIDELTELGYNLRFDVQSANGDLNTAASIAAKFKADRVKLAIGIATPTAVALANTISDIPVIFSAVTDPVGAGLVKNLERGERNITGISDMTPVREQIELLASSKQIRRLGHVYTSSEANAVALAAIAKKTAQEMGMEFVETTVTNSTEVRQAAQAIIGRVDALYVSTDNTVVSALSSLIDVATRRGVPVMSADPSSAQTIGVLAAYGFDYYKLGRATGKLAAEVLEGTLPAEIPTRFMTDPSDLDLIINLDVAKTLGITIPAEILAKANKIIENGVLTSR